MIPALAVLPILVILVLMLGLRWSAARAGAVGAAMALAVALLAFDFPSAAVPVPGVSAAIGGVLAEAAFTALTVLWIIGPALGIHELQLRTGAAEVLRASLASFAPDPRILALLVAWFFVLFVEGAAGFGASVALAAPFLVAAGFNPVQAVTITLIGHAVGVSFGAVGTPVMPQMQTTGFSGLEIARATGIHHSLLGWLPLVVMVTMVNRSVSGAARNSNVWIWTAVAFACFVVPYTLLWWLVGPELPTMAGALFGGIMFVALLRHFGPAVNADTSLTTIRAVDVVRAAAPYLVLVTMVLVTRLVPAMREWLQSITVQWQLHGTFSGSMPPLYHPGTMLLTGFVVGAILQRATARDVFGAIRDATLRLVPVAAALFAMLALSRIMVHAGMTTELAIAAASSAGAAWPLFAPFVGVLGTFVTGSATASNILFTDFQQETALAGRLPVLEVIGAQGFGAAVGNMVCPHNVVAAGATVGLAGREGDILRRTLWVALAYATLGGVLALLLVAA